MSKDFDVKKILSERVEQSLKVGDSDWREYIANSATVYHKFRNEPMSPMKKAVLASTLNQFKSYLKQKGYSEEAIKSAAENIADVENPLSMIFNLISIIVPNYAYADFAAVQPMPTEESPVFFPQLTAVDDRNGIVAGTTLLGSTGWSSNHNYTTGRWTNVEVAFVAGSDTATYTCPNVPLLPKTIKMKFFFGGNWYFASDNGSGSLVGASCLSASTVNYDTGAINLTFVSNLSASDGIWVRELRYDLNKYDPAKVIYQFSTIPMKAYPMRLRSEYSLDNFYAAKQVLKDYDIAAALATSMAGYINKEVSCAVFENALDQADFNTTFTYSVLPAGVSWAYHRLQLLEKIVGMSNLIRKSIGRGAGNVIAASTAMMNIIETFDNTLWSPKKYDREPIGPYVAGELAGKFKIIKDQDLPTDRAVMTYKADDVDASYAVGVFIGLYATDPLAFDDLKVRRGMGVKMGEKKILPNSIGEIIIA